MTKINKIVDVLTVLNTDKRDESISSIIKHTLQSLGSASTINELVQFISIEYEVDFKVEEIKEITERLVDEGALERDGDKLSNSISTNEEIVAKHKENRSVLEKGFSQFQNSYKSICNSDVPFELLKRLHEILLDYLNECFYVYGKSAINFFKPFEKNDDKDIVSRKRILDNALLKIEDAKHKKFFEEYIKVFPTLLTNDEELFLEKLADKTEYFFALGLPKELFEEIQNINPINLSLYLDTNVLLSVLNLRKHTSNSACIRLIQLINENSASLNISVFYTNKTYNELKRTKNELEGLVSKVDIDRKIVQAGLKTDKIDAYTSSYYEEYLKFGSSVKHPVEKLKRAIEILSSHNIKIDRGEYKELLESEDFKDELSAYNKFQLIKNEARAEKQLPPKRDKDIFKIEHDVLIREIILQKREQLESKSSNDLMSNKYYGLTLDKVLIDFDRYSLKRKYLNDDVFVPTFFSPTYLLKKLYKFLPIQSDNYRKAFISAVSSPVFEDNRQDSKSLQDTLMDFHSLGINDPAFIVKCLMNDHFLDEIRSKRSENIEAIKDFVENELQKDYQEVLKEKEEKEEILTGYEVKNKELQSQKTLSEEANKSLREREEGLKTDIGNLSLSLKSLKKQMEKLSILDKSSAAQYNLEDKSVIEQLKLEKGEISEQYKELKLEVGEKEARRKLKSWRLAGWFSMVMSILVLIIFLMAFVQQDWKYNYVAALLDWAESLKDLRKEIIKLALTALFGTAQYLLVSIFYHRIINKSNIKAKYQEIIGEFTS